MQSDTGDTVLKNKQHIRVVPFEKAHLCVADLRGHDIEEIFRGADLLQGHPSITLVGNEGIILFLGIVLSEGVGTVWLVPTTKFNGSSLGAVKVIKKYEADYVERFSLTRLETNGHDDPVVRRWLGWLGFVHKGGELYIKEL